MCLKLYAALAEQVSVTFLRSWMVSIVVLTVATHILIIHQTISQLRFIFNLLFCNIYFTLKHVKYCCMLINVWYVIVQTVQIHFKNLVQTNLMDMVSKADTSQTNG